MIKNSIVVGFLLILQTLSAAADASAGILEQRILAYHVSEAWGSDYLGARVDLLKIVEMTCPQEVSRLLVSERGGERVVIDHIIEPPRGKTRIRLLADDYGWTVVLADSSGRRMSVENLGVYGSLLWEQPNQIKGDWTLTRTVTLNDKLLGEVTSAIQDSDINGQLEKVLSVNGGFTTIVATIPPGVARTVLLLESVVSSKSGSGSSMAYLRPLLELIGAAIRTSEGDSALEFQGVDWKQTPQGGGSGVEFIHGPQRDFITLFKSIELVRNPLGKLRGPADGGCPARAVGRE